MFRHSPDRSWTLLSYHVQFVPLNDLAYPLLLDILQFNSRYEIKRASSGDKIREGIFNVVRYYVWSSNETILSWSCTFDIPHHIWSWDIFFFPWAFFSNCLSSNMRTGWSHIMHFIFCPFHGIPSFVKVARWHTPKIKLSSLSC